MLNTTDINEREQDFKKKKFYYYRSSLSALVIADGV